MATTTELLEQALERSRNQRIEPDRELLRCAIERAGLSLGEIGRQIAGAVEQTPEAARVKLSRFLWARDRTLAVGFHEAVVGALVDAMAERNGGEVISDDDRELTGALALDRMRAEMEEELHGLDHEIRRYETALALADTRRDQVLSDRAEVLAALAQAVEGVA